MSHTYPSSYLQGRAHKIAFLIDCVDGLNGLALTSSLIEQFPENSDIFLFYHRDEPGMIRRLNRLESNHRGVFFYPTEFDGIAMNISFILGLVSSIYDNFVVITPYHPTFNDLCEQLIDEHRRLRNHIQFRSFERFYEFEQFVTALARLHSETSSTDTTPKTHVLNYDRNSLFHSCPYETVKQSSIVYRFGELLHHLESEHQDANYEYCRECEQMVNERNFDDVHSFEEHIQNDHWDNVKGFQLSISSNK